MSNPLAQRTLKHIIASVPTSDGAGVKLRRSLGSVRGQHLDPFLMLDEFYSDNPDDYLAGFPEHPHRGFETVTYMLDGHMRHEDHLGHRGDLAPGDVQWMTAAGGIIHSEMPQQTQGRMRGFQMWLNLPGSEKLKPAHYRDIPARSIPLIDLPSGGHIKVIAGTLRLDGRDTAGPANNAQHRISTDPLYLDVQLTPGQAVTLPLPAGYNAFAYLYEGELRIGADAADPAAAALPLRAAGILSDGDQVTLQAGNAGAQLLLAAARPIGEPVVQYGPFVMNTREQIEQAVRDYQTGHLG